MTFLPLTYFPSHEENRMNGEGHLEAARERFFHQKSRNLRFLLGQRYSWMNSFLEGKKDVIELGAGAGFSKEFIKSPSLRLTDVHRNPWIDQVADALNLPFEDNSLDAVLCSHMIHHLASPKVFFNEIYRVLRPGGVLVISDIYTSTFMRFLLRLMRHEGWSYEVDVFDSSAIANDPRDPWSANCAIPELLFDRPELFKKSFSGFEFLKNDRCECLIFPLSGGVIAQTRTIPLPGFLLKFVDIVDQLLVKISPKTFALGMRVVLRKINS